MAKPNFSNPAQCSQSEIDRFWLPVLMLCALYGAENVMEELPENPLGQDLAMTIWLTFGDESWL